MALTKFIYHLKADSNCKWIEWNGSALFCHKKLLDMSYYVSQNYWIINDDSEIEEIEKTFLCSLPKWPPENYVRSRETIYKYCSKIASPSLVKTLANKGVERFIPQKRYWKLLCAFAKQMCEVLEACDLNYWRILQEHKIKFQFVCRVDTKGVVDTLADPQATGKEPLNTLLNSSTQNENLPEACTEVFSFQRINSVTGRMTWKSGPNVLRLKKEYRRFLLSRFGDKGKLWSFDYSAIEPRILLLIKDILNVNPSTTPLITSLIGNLPRHHFSKELPEDIYSKVLEDLALEKKVPRKIAKTAVLATLYGQNPELTAKTISEYVDKPHDFLAAVADYFGVEALQKTLARDFVYSNRNVIRSFYGRPILCEDGRPSRLLNYYIQSTAVDATLSGFSRIVKPLNDKRPRDIVCMFCIHDALILDIHSMDSQEELEYTIKRIEERGSFGILGFENVNFFLRASPFSYSTNLESRDLSNQETEESLQNT